MEETVSTVVPALAGWADIVTGTARAEASSAPAAIAFFVLIMGDHSMSYGAGPADTRG
ncbi:hypothetical protein AB0D67_14980 [Streptosporangium sp. NPDC048047]|uniref:hypothetical protein n=1 Tax=unclassified Streptosporangium TaxID=2632669 RepID=UPI00342E22E8